MRHPDEVQLQAYHDGELEGQVRQQIHAHLGQCAPCAERLREWGELSATLRQTRPAVEAFGSDGEFWARLAGRLPKTRPSAWPLVPYLPPFLLGAFGLLAEGLMSIAFIVYALIGMGVIQPLAPTLTAWLSKALADPLLENSLYAWLGWSSSDVIRSVTQPLGAMSLATQETIFLLAVVLGLGTFLSLVVIVYFSWAMCWSKTARLDGNRGK
jgi:hypothetical protein